MKRLVLLIVIALLTLGASCRRATRSAVVANLQPSPTSLPTEFASTGNINIYREDYVRRSDGATVGFGCQDHASPSKVLAIVHSRARRPSQVTDVIDANGTKIGERVARGARSASEAEIVWSEGSRLFYIDAASLD